MPSELLYQKAAVEVFKVKFNLNSPLRLYAKDMNTEEFFQFCQLNNELNIERTADGQMIIMAPSGCETGR